MEDEYYKIREVVNLADKIKEQRPLIKDFEALQLAVEIFKIDRFNEIDLTLCSINEQLQKLTASINER